MEYRKPQKSVVEASMYFVVYIDFHFAEFVN